MKYKTIVSAALQGDLESTGQFLEKRANPNQRTNGLKNTLLQLVVRNGLNDIAILLLEYGAHVNTKNIFGDTPLHDAAQTNNEVLVQYLLAKGANLLVKNKAGKTAGGLAAELGFYKVAASLHPAVKIAEANALFFKPTISEGIEQIIIDIDPTYFDGFSH
jgi:ankyrin repeat protein